MTPHSATPNQAAPTDAAPSTVTRHVQADHERIKALMSDIAHHASETVAADGFIAWKMELLWLLRDFQGQLLKHFDLEEDGGFVDDLRRLAPQWSRQIDRIGVEHVEIRGQLSTLIGTLKAANGLAAASLPELREQLHELLTAIKVHEALEGDLMQRAYYQVYGGGD